MRTLLVLAGLVSLSACKPLSPAGGPREARDIDAYDIDASRLRFVTWNINTIGFPGETEYAAMSDVVNRLQPDILAINEIEDDEDSFIAEDFAAEHGYPFIVVGDHVSMGDDRNAIMSRYPLTPFGVQLSQDPGEEGFMGWNSPALSGDPAALDISRAIVAARIDTPEGSVGVVSLHWKSGGSENKTEFRRAVDVARTLQALDRFTEADHLLAAGDLNVDTFDNAPTPTAFHDVPTGFPARYNVGTDMLARIASPDGLRNHPHATLEEYGLVMNAALQADGSPTTRPSSGRVLDYVYTSPGMVPVDSEVYNSIFDDATGGVPKAGEPLDTLACAQATDHLPVVVDFDMSESGGGGGGPTVLDVDSLTVGDLQITELLADPVDCSDSAGEWIEVHNTSGFPVDLEGVRVRDRSLNVGTLGAISLPVDGYAVLARSASACNVSVDGVFDQVTLNNSGDDVELVASADVVVASVTYGQSEPGLTWREDASGAWCIGPATAG
ncbi:MAG: lamin tail domain-containing protein, partial [Myxococcales bacterium]|nr:lamin tail domain-containing protein [Myxococcales bacterium]